MKSNPRDKGWKRKMYVLIFKKGNLNHFHDKNNVTSSEIIIILLYTRVKKKTHIININEERESDLTSEDWPAISAQ